MENKRLVWLDAARGIFMLMVVMIHCATTELRNDITVCRYIYEFNFFWAREGFMALAGYTLYLASDKYRSRNSKDLIKDKAQRLMLPYFTYGLIVYVIFRLAFLLPKLKSVMEYSVYRSVPFSTWLFSMLRGEPLYTLHLWFLFYLFIFTTLAFACLETGRYWRIKLAGLWLGSYLVIWFMPISTQGIIDNYYYFGGFFLFGLLVLPCIKENKLWMLGALAGVIYFAAYMKYGSVFVSMGSMHEPLNIAVRCIFILGVIEIAKHIRGKIKSILEHIGKNSMYIYLFSQPFFGSCIGVVGYKVIHLPWIVVFAAAFVCSVAIPLVIVRILEHTTCLKLLFGYKKIGGANERQLQRT